MSFFTYLRLNWRIRRDERRDRRTLHGESLIRAVRRLEIAR